MNAKERFYSGLAKETIGKITSNTDNWTSFLRTMSRNYEFTYPEQVMIYAQRPNATFCKPYEDWNAENYRRYVKRGSTGIALFVMNRDKPYLRYVFDVADTGVRRSSPELKPWEVTPENRSYVMEAMERTFGVAADGVLEAQLEDIASALAAEYWDDYKKQFLDIVANSFLEEYDELNIEVAFKNAVANSVRLRSLGEGYSKEEIQAVISGKNLHKSKGGSAKAPAPKQFQMLIDIQAKMAEGKTVGYEKWAKKFNRKEAARTVILLKEKGLGNYDDLTAHIENLSARFDALSDSIKVAEKRMVEVQALQQHIKNYRNTRQIYIEYRKSGYSKKFFEEHRQEITIHKAAKQAFDELQITKLPSMQSLYEEFHQLAVQKKQDYAEYRQIRKEKEELLIAKRTVETILNIDRQKEQEKEKEKEEKKNFR